MRSLAVRVLSDFGVDGIEPQALGSRKARLALQLLAIAEGQAVPADVLIDALWGTAPPARPEDQVAVLMSRLRSVLGRDRIEHRDRGYLLNCDWLDATELAGVTREMESRRQAGHMMGAVAAARVALSLIRGEGPLPLPGEWAQLRHAEFERLISRARLVAATALLEAGDWMAAADAASAAAERDPYDEVALRILLRAHVMGGRMAGALALYASARRRMADELGTDPSPETAALYTAILRGELAVPARPSPAATSGVVGRAEELSGLEAIAARARGGCTEVIVVDGEAGIGKTTLLRAWADQRTAAGDTVLMASCGPLDRSLPLDALLTALAGLLRELGPDVTADLLADDAAILAPLLGAAPSRRAPPMLADIMLGPGVLYAALVRVLDAPGADHRRCAPGRPRAAGLASFRPARAARGGGGRRGPARGRRAPAGHGLYPSRCARPGGGG
jgi:DNA-binding SARP family transcriptional activator